MPVSVVDTVYSITVHCCIEYCVVVYTLFFLYFPLFLLDYKSVFVHPCESVGLPIMWICLEKKLCDNVAYCLA